MHLARSATCENQAFRYGHNAYGLQCHLELDERLINRWLNLPEYVVDIEKYGCQGDAATIKKQTHELIGQSAKLSFEMFGQFLRPLGERRSGMYFLPADQTLGAEVTADVTSNPERNQNPGLRTRSRLPCALCGCSRQPKVLKPGFWLLSSFRSEICAIVNPLGRRDQYSPFWAFRCREQRKSEQGCLERAQKGEY